MFALRISDLIETSEMVVFWRTWWLGTLAGALVVLPLAMAWTVGWRTAAWRGGGLAEGVLMLAAVAGLSVVALSVEQQVTYLVFPAFIWAALRFGPQGATLAVALSTGIAMAITAYDRGAFIERETDQSALNLQLYVLIASVSTLCLAAIVSERRRAEVELADSRARIVAAGARERRRLEAELHDSGQNRIVALLMRLGLARETAESAAPDLVPSLDLMIADAQAMTEELRRIAHGILPPVLASEGVAAALRAETVHSAIGVLVVDDGVGRSEQDVELAVYLCCLEAIQNAAKHGGRGAAATVMLQPVAGELRFTVHDTGAGFATEAASAGAGLTNVRDRIETVGGRIEVVSALGRGTTVSGAVPWPTAWD
jgi:signal transduction histidine kinase